MAVKKIPQRKCVGCQTIRGKKELIRIVRTPTGEILIDPTGKKPGRGAYLCPDEQCLVKAVKEKRLEKALEHAIAPEVFDQLRSGLVKP